MRPAYVAVAGTHGSRRPHEWCDRDSAFAAFLEGHGLVNIAGLATRPYAWSTDLDFGRGHEDWIAGGAALYYYLVPALRPDLQLPPGETIVITHSHGLQVALYAAAMGLKIDRLVDVAGPVRADMRAIAEKARPNVRRWLHLHSDFSDAWQWLGELFDGHLGIVRDHPLADVNNGVRKVGHGGLLRDPNDFHFWIDRGWLAFLLAGPVAGAAV